MTRVMATYFRVVDAVNCRIGRIMMYGLFVMMAVLLWSSISKTFFLPSLWTLETAQFAMVAYYIMGGPYSIQLGSNVRMDLIYGSWSVRKKAWFGSFTVLFLVLYLGVLLYGGLGSTAYSLGYWGDETLSYFGELAGAFRHRWTGSRRRGCRPDRTQPDRLAALSMADQVADVLRHLPDAAAGRVGTVQGYRLHEGLSMGAACRCRMR